MASFFSRSSSESEMPPDPAPATDLPPDEERAQLLVNLAGNFAWMREMQAPLFDAADGMRAELLARGWSPPAAETLVQGWTYTCLNFITQGDQS